jgi:hypothetical protein
VDDAVTVRVIERVGHLSGNTQQLTDRQRATHQAMFQRLALDALEHEKRQPLVVAYVVQRTNMRMPQRRERPRLAIEPLSAGGALGNVRRQHFDCNGSVETQVDRSIHFSHRAPTEERDDLVRP